MSQQWHHDAFHVDTLNKIMQIDITLRGRISKQMCISTLCTCRMVNTTPAAVHAQITRQHLSAIHQKDISKNYLCLIVGYFPDHQTEVSWQWVYSNANFHC